MFSCRLSATEVSVNLLFWPSAKKLKFIGKFGDGMSNWRNHNLRASFEHYGFHFLVPNYCSKQDTEVADAFHTIYTFIS